MTALIRRLDYNNTIFTRDSLHPPLSFVTSVRSALLLKDTTQKVCVCHTSGVRYEELELSIKCLFNESNLK